MNTTTDYHPRRHHDPRPLSCTLNSGACIAGIGLLIIPALLGLAISFAHAASSEPGADSRAQQLEPTKFAEPPQEYRPIDCWWWDGAPLDRERLRWQLEDMHAKGVGGTWLYPRFHASQAMSAEPGFWTEGWWKFVEFALDEHQRLGMVQWANDWIGRFDKNYFQTLLMNERDQNPALIGHRLAFHQAVSTAAGEVAVTVQEDQTILTAAAYKQIAKRDDAVDGETRIDLSKQIDGREVRWQAPEAGWSVIVVVSEPHGLDYIGGEVARRWIEMYFEKYREHLGSRLGKSLAAYGPDERFVLNGNILYSDALRQQIKQTKGYDPLADLPALFVDVGPQTDKIRCEYYDAMVTQLEDHFYGPIAKWLHDHGMKQATIATWGRENLLGQVFNYGDFFRMMSHFDITGNEDSAANGAGAFIDSKLSSSIAHVNGTQRVAVCAYWGTGWGYTQQENVARTNVNYALGVNLFNTHGVLYSFMGGRNEYVPPEVHFYQPYWQTWRSHYDRITRLSYVLSQGDHRADVAIVYPVSTLHAQWHGGSKFAPAAREAQQSMFALAKSIYNRGIDFDFIDEAHLASARCSAGKLLPARLQISTVVLPQMSTIRSDVAKQLEKFVASGGTLLVYGKPPTASADRGRDDPALVRMWQDLLGDYAAAKGEVVRRRNSAGGQAILLRRGEAEAAEVLAAASQPDVQFSQPDVIYTHQQVGKQQVYYFVNRHSEKRSIEATVRCHGTPEIWDARTGEITPLYRYESLPQGTKLKFELDPHADLLVVVQPGDAGTEVVEDNLASVDEVRAIDKGFEVAGSVATAEQPFVKLAADGRSYVGRSAKLAPPAPRELAGLWNCEYRPTMDNRWGDFRYPAADRLIGPEMPMMKFHPEPASSSPHLAWAAADFDDSEWRDATCTYGPYWEVLGPFDQKLDSPQLAERLIGTSHSDEVLEVGEKRLIWKQYLYSQKFGVQRRDLDQTMDGMGPVSPDFLVFDRPRDGRAAVCYLRTRLLSPREQELYLLFGNGSDSAPRKAWVNGRAVVNVEGDEIKAVGKVALQKGANDVVLQIAMPYVKPAPKRKYSSADELASPPSSVSNLRVATFAVFLDTAEAPEPPRYLPISRWYQTTADVVLDYRPAGAQSTGWFRFPAPPGARTARLSLSAESVEGWVNGQRCEIADGELKFPADVIAEGKSSQVALRVKFHPGCYEGAAFREPIAFDCGQGKIPLGDWSDAALQYYSGGLTYSKTVQLTPEQIAGAVTLDLGEVRTSAEVTVNGQSLGVRLAKPFTFDLSKVVRPGENEIRVNVLNTLANYMSAQPSRYVFKGQTVSGLLGPASLKFASKVQVVCTPEPVAPGKAAVNKP